MADLSIRENIILGLQARRGWARPIPRAEQNRLAALFAITDAGDPALMGGSSAGLGGFKAALRLLGVIECADTAAPQVPLGEAAVKTVRQLLEEGGLLP